MTQYIETVTKAGSSIRIEVEDTSKPVPGFSRATSPTNISTEAAKDAYSQFLDAIRDCADGLIETIQQLNDPPSSASLDFAVKIEAEAGAMVAKSRDEGQFKVSLSWKQAEPEKAEKKK